MGLIIIANVIQNIYIQYNVSVLYFPKNKIFLYVQLISGKNRRIFSILVPGVYSHDDEAFLNTKKVSNEFFFIKFVEVYFE